MYKVGGNFGQRRQNKGPLSYPWVGDLKELGSCRVLCVYLRGDRQRSWSNMPAAGDTFSIATRLIEPRTELRGLRGSRDLANQVLRQLVEMEEEYLASPA